MKDRFRFEVAECDREMVLSEEGIPPRSALFKSSNLVQVIYYKRVSVFLTDAFPRNHFFNDFRKPSGSD